MGIHTHRPKMVERNNVRGVERRGDNTKDEENVLQNMHHLQEVRELTFVDQIRLRV